MKLTLREHDRLETARERLWQQIGKNKPEDASPAKLPEIALTRPETRPLRFLVDCNDCPDHLFSDAVAAAAKADELAKGSQFNVTVWHDGEKVYTAEAGL